MGHSNFDPVETVPAWNAGRKLGAKRPLKPKEIWSIRLLDQARKVRDRALFDLAIDSKLRGCDLVRIKIGDLVAGGRAERTAAEPASSPESRLSAIGHFRSFHRIC